MTQDIFLLIEHIQGQVSDITYIMAAAAKELSQNEGDSVIGILFGSGAEGLKDSLAVDKVIYCDHPALAEFTSDAYKRTLISLLEDYSPRAILFGNTTLGADVSSSLASHLKFPIISSCIKISDSGRIRNELQTLCSEALEHGADGAIHVAFDKIPKDVISLEKRQELKEILQWYKTNHPIWFGWLDLG